jgi:DNA-binding beta-propeller fold protein YncE
MKIMIAAAFFMWLGAPCAQTQMTLPLALQRTIRLPQGTGRFDHFAIDLQANRLFIAATGNHTVEVLDLNSGKVTETIAGFGKPHGLAWIPESNMLYASDGAQGDLKILAGSPLKETKSINLSEDADDLVYDAASSLLYVGHGGSDQANPAKVAVIDTTRQTLIKDLPVASHPEGLDIDNARGRIFVNIAAAAEVAVIDGKTSSLSEPWKITRAKDNVPLAFDQEQDLLFVACRTPGRLVVLDGASGNELSDLPADEGADDLFYDPELHRIYLIAGSGVIDAYEVGADKTVRAVGVTRTSAGAKTGLLAPSQHALYIGAAATGGKEAEIRVYSTR